MSITKARQLAEFIANADVDSDEIATGAVSASKLAATLDLSSKTISMPDVAAFNITSGDVGIGTANPAEKFHIASSSGNTILNLQRTNTNTTGTVGALTFTASDGHVVAAVNALGDGNDDGANLQFRTTSAASGTNYYNDTDPRMTILGSNGNVGIGETNPQYQLHLAKSGSNYIQIDNDSTSVTAFLGVASDHLWLGTSTNHQLNFYANSDIKMVIDTAGKVGIGTESPVGTLHLHSADTAVRLTSNQGSNTPLAQLQYSGSGGYFLRLGDSSNNEDVMIRTYGNSHFNGGNVGIGTSSPAYKFHQHENSSSENYHLFTNSTTGSTSSDGFRIGIDSNENALIWHRENNSVLFATNNTERMRIDSSGRLTVGSIGTDTTLSGGQPGLQVTGSGFNGYMAAVRRDSSVYSSGLLLAKSRNSSAGSFTALQDNDQIGSIIFIGDDGTDLDTYGAMIQAEVNGTPSNNNMPADLIFSTNSGTSTITERMRIRKDGNVGIGVEAPEAKLHVENAATGTAAYIENNFSWTAANLSEFSNSAFTIRPRNSDIYLKTSGSTNDVRFQAINAANNASRDILLNPFGGKVGIGVVSPANRLEVNSSNGSWRVNDYGSMYFQNTSDANNERYIHSRSNGDLSIGYIPIASLTGGAGGYAATTYDQMNILADGKVGIGTTSPSVNKGLHVRGGLFIDQQASDANNISGQDTVLQVTKLDNKDWTASFDGESGTATDYGIRVKTATSAVYGIALLAASSYRFRVEGDGDVKNSNNSYGSISDIKLKENIVDATSQWDDIKAVRVRKYSFISDQLDAPNQLGVIAQELESAGMNGLVTSTPDIDDDKNLTGTSTKEVKYSILYMKAIKALQEAMTKIETLETQVSDLTTRIDALEG